MNKVEKIRAAAQKWQDTVTGKMGFAFFDFNTGESCCLHEDTPFPTASVFKIFVLAELYRQVEAGIVKLDDVIHTEKKDFAPGSGAIVRFRHDCDLTVYNHAVLMMMISDNTSTDVIFNLVTRDAVRENLIEPLGMQETKIDYNCTDLIRSFYQIPQGETLESHTKKLGGAMKRNLRDSAPAHCAEEFADCTSPRDMITMLRSLHDATILSRESCEEVMNLMKPFPKYHRLEKYLPAGTKICRKTGSLDRVVNDAGIVYSPKGDYIIAVFYNGNLADEEEYAGEFKKLMGEELISKVSEEVYRIYTEG